MTVIRPYSEEYTLSFHTPDAPDVPNRYGSGTIRPTDVTITYRDEDGHRTVTVLLEGAWRRPGGELTDAPCSQSYPGHRPDEEWPGWLTRLAEDHEPQQWRKTRTETREDQ